jgi:hypothetical protein
MIDSNFSDLDEPQPAQFLHQSGNSPITPSTTPNKKFKIHGKIYDSSLDDKIIKDKSFEMFKSASNPDNFTGDFLNYGGVQPDEDVQIILGKIYSDANTKNPDLRIQNYITKYMRRFMNNRIGTFLKETEYANVRKDDSSTMKPGQIVVQDQGVGNNKFVLYLGSDSTGSATILTREEPTGNEIIDKNVPLTSLYNYSRFESIQQNYNVEDGNLSEDSILETYNLVF